MLCPGVSLCGLVLPDVCRRAPASGQRHLQLSPQRLGCPAQRLQLDLIVVGIEQPVELAPAGLHQHRSAFDRATASAPPPPPVEVKLTGIFRVGKELRASLVINGQSIVVRKGDETTAGKVLKIEAGLVVVSGAIEQRLEMFR